MDAEEWASFVSDGDLILMVSGYPITFGSWLGFDLGLPINSIL